MLPSMDAEATMKIQLLELFELVETLSQDTEKAEELRKRARDLINAGKAERDAAKARLDISETQKDRLVDELEEARRKQEAMGTEITHLEARLKRLGSDAVGASSNGGGVPTVSGGDQYIEEGSDSNEQAAVRVQSELKLFEQDAAKPSTDENGVPGASTVERLTKEENQSQGEFASLSGTYVTLRALANSALEENARKRPRESSTGGTDRPSKIVRHNGSCEENDAKAGRMPEVALDVTPAHFSTATTSTITAASRQLAPPSRHTNSFILQNEGVPARVVHHRGGMLASRGRGLPQSMDFRGRGRDPIFRWA